MHIFSVVVEIPKKYTRIYRHDTLSLMVMWRAPYMVEIKS